MFTALTETWRRTTESVEDVEFGEFKDIVPDSEGKVTKQDLKTVGDLIDAFYSAYVLKLDHNYSNRTEVFGDLQSGSILTAKL